MNYLIIVWCWPYIKIYFLIRRVTNKSRQIMDKYTRLRNRTIGTVSCRNEAEASFFSLSLFLSLERRGGEGRHKSLSEESFSRLEIVWSTCDTATWCRRREDYVDLPRVISGWFHVDRVPLSSMSFSYKEFQSCRQAISELYKLLDDRCDW